MSYFICPKCKKDFNKIQNSLVCPNGHCYDISKNGYVNLLIHKSSKNPGDNKGMVDARKIAMQNGYYNCLSDVLKNILNDYTPSIILDMACGEGTLTEQIACENWITLGVDISKSAINSAASKSKDKVKYAVANVHDLPIKDKSIDVVLSCFAPLYANETLRVLKDDGIILKVTPHDNHLWELKKEIYDTPYYNSQKPFPKELVEVKSMVIQDSITLSGEYLDAVIQMTPYFYKTPKELLQRVKGKEIKTTISFCVTVLKKVR